jgi:hypothetical protein
MSKSGNGMPDKARMAELIATPGPSDSPLWIKGNLRRYGQRIVWATQVVDGLCDMWGHHEWNNKARARKPEKAAR